MMSKFKNEKRGGLLAAVNFLNRLIFTDRFDGISAMVIDKVSVSDSVY